MSLRQLSCILLALTAAFAAGCGDEDATEPDTGGDPGSAATTTFEEPDVGITFEHPADFEELDEIELSRQEGVAADVTAAVGIDDANALVVQRFPLDAEVTRQNLDTVTDQADALFSDLAGEELQGRRTEVAGLPALEYEFGLEDPSEAVTRATAIFDGDVQYLLNCQSEPELRERIVAACDLALETLEVR